MFRLFFISCMMVVVSAESIDWGRVFQDLKSIKWDLLKKKLLEKLEEPDVCRTQECYSIAAGFWESMNQSVDPCENFYEYACGGWAASNPIPPTEFQWSPFQKMRSEVFNRIRDILEEKIQPSDIQPIKQAKKYYKSCMDVRALEKRGIKPIEAFLMRNGGWPMVMEPGEWNSELFSWQEIHRFYLQLIHLTPFYHIHLTKDFRSEESNSSSDNSEDRKKVIMISPPLVPSANIIYSFRKLFSLTDIYEDGSYAKYMSDVVRIFAKGRSAVIDEEQLERDVNDIVQLEMKLEEIYARDDSEDRYVTINEVQAIYESNRTHLSEESDSSNFTNHQIDWKSTIIEYFAEVNVKVDGNETVVIPPTDHFETLADILYNTDPRIIGRNQAFFRDDFKEYVYAKLRKKWERCLRGLWMNHAVAYQYVNKYFEDSMKDDAEEIFMGIQKQMIKHILKADWLSNEMRRVELKKIKKMRMNTGYPDWYNNVTALTNIYHGLVIGNQFFDNALSMRRYAMRKYLQSKNIPDNMDDWFAHPLIVNAFYVPMLNSLSIPAADFQLPLYSPSQPSSVNYGELGILISHEVSHGFDINGIRFDHNGEYYEWSDDIFEDYENNTRCYIDQFKNFYKDDESRSDNSTEEGGTISLGENMADSVGLEMVFGALEENEKESKSLRLPGFEDWSNEKLFFLSFAKVWCTSISPELENLIGKYHVHSEPKYRINAPVQNSEEFARIFECPKGSPMNPEIKCKIW